MEDRMPWDDIARKQHNRDRLRYPSDLTDGEWVLVAQFIPPAKPGGRPRTTDIREVLNAILYIVGGGCQWPMLPKDFPPVSTVRCYFYAWQNAGLWQTINHLLAMSTRE
jgi:putative transposase